MQYHQLHKHIASLALVSIIFMSGCYSSPELPPASTNHKTLSSKDDNTKWVIEPQPEDSKEIVRRYKTNALGIREEVHIDLKDGSKAIQHLDAFGKRVTTLSVECAPDETSISVTFDQKRNILSLTQKDGKTGKLLSRFEKLTDGTEKLTYYHPDSGCKLAEVTGETILAEEPSGPASTATSQTDLDQIDCQPAFARNEWILFHNDGTTPYIKLGISRYNFHHGLVAIEGTTPYWPIYQMDVYTYKQMFSFEGYLIYEEKFAGIKRHHDTEIVVSEYECFTYSANKTALYKAIITKAPFDAHVPKIGTIRQFDEFEHDGITVKASRTFNTLVGWLAQEGKNIDIDNSFKALHFASDKCFEQIKTYQTQYNNHLNLAVLLSN
jgi:hypothetical protein